MREGTIVSPFIIQIFYCYYYYYIIIYRELDPIMVTKMNKTDIPALMEFVV